MQRVFLLTRDALFGRGLAHLLRSDPDVELVGTASNPATALAQMDQLALDVLVAELDHLQPEIGPMLARLMETRASTTLIGLSSESNAVTVCRTEQCVTRSLEDFQRIMKTTPSSNSIQGGNPNQTEQPATGATGAGDAADPRVATPGVSGANRTPASDHPEMAAHVRVQERIAAEPSYRQILYRLLEYCSTPRTGPEIFAWLQPQPEMQIALHTPAMLLNWMVKAGGIASITPEDQEPIWQTTAAGQRVVTENEPAKRIQEMLAKEPPYRGVYSQILAYCATPRTRAEIETLLHGHPALESPAILPSYLIEQLEAAGGLEWTGKWQSTSAGKGVI